MSAESSPADRSAALVLDLIRARYGVSLTIEEASRLQRDVERTLEHLARLRPLPLSNADEPDIQFSVEVVR